jgi:thiamine biosynthesis lipoprotein
MNRRVFLDPLKLARCAGLAQGVVANLRTSPDRPERDTALLRLGRQAMATTFEILLPLGTRHATRAAAAAFDEIDRLEQQLSAYREDSELSQLNRTAALGPVPIERGFFELLENAARLSAETDGAFDVTAGPLVKAWGFFRRQGRVPQVHERHEILQRIGMRHVALDASAGTVAYRQPGLEINLGSIGKGYAVDRAAHILRQNLGLDAGLLHAGHSSILAFGAPSVDSRGWAVRIRHPWDTTASLGTIRLRDRAMATSAATFQHVDFEGRRLGHLIDPRTGWPAEGLASATAIAPTAAEADALATAFFVFGVDKTQAYCQGRPGYGAVLLAASEHARPLAIGLTHDELTLHDSTRGDAT